MPSLSVCMIVKNEEFFLEQCLESLKNYVDEIIIVDTGSTDKTKEIARKFTDRVYEHEWPNDFSKARNISLGYATKDWILVLDADEIISEEDINKIKELIKNDAISGYLLIQRSYTDNSALINWTPCYKESAYTREFTGYTPSRLVRLFRNKKEFRYRNKVHELVEYSIEENRGKIERQDIAIHHYGEYRGEYVKKEKGIKYFRLGEEQIKENPNEARAYYETGVGCLVRKDYQKAIEKFEMVVKINPMYREAYYNLGSAYHSLGRLEEAEKNLRKSIETNAKITASHNLLGKILFDKGKVKEGINILFEGLKADSKNVLLYQTLGGILAAIGKHEQAIHILKLGIKLTPLDADMYINLGGAYFVQKEFNKAVEVLEKAMEIDPKRFEIYKNLYVVLINKGEKDKAAEVLKKAKKLFPEYNKLIEEQLAQVSDKPHML